MRNDWTIPLPLIWRYRVNGPHTGNVMFSRTRGVDNAIPNTMIDVFGNNNYVEHIPWQIVDISPWIAIEDRNKPILAVFIAIKLEISARSPGQYGLGVKVLNPYCIAESAVTDFQQIEGSHWVQNTAQSAQLNAGSVRDWVHVICAPTDQKIKIGGCWRPPSPPADVDMAFEIHLDGYAFPI